MRDDLHHHTHLNKVIFVFPTFAILAQERKFESIWAILADPTTSSHWLPRNALHTLCQHQPTEKVVRRVISLLSITCDLEVDSHGRTPLHIAAAYGSDVKVLRLLLGDACSTAASVLDAASRFPLHYAAGATTRQLRFGDQTDDLENSILTVQLLLEAFPIAVLAKDDKGKTAIDLALECSKHQRFVACLHLESKMLQRRNCAENDVHTENTETNTEEESSSSSHGSGSDDNSIQSPIVVFDPDVSNFLKHMSTQSRPEHDDDETYNDDDDDLSSLGTFGVSQVFVPCARRSIREYAKVEF